MLAVAGWSAPDDGGFRGAADSEAAPAVDACRGTDDPDDMFGITSVSEDKESTDWVAEGRKPGIKILLWILAAFRSRPCNSVQSMP